MPPIPPYFPSIAASEERQTYLIGPYHVRHTLANDIYLTCKFNILHVSYGGGAGGSRGPLEYSELSQTHAAHKRPASSMFCS